MQTETVTVVSYGEPGTKSSEVRAKMERRLRTTVEAALDARGVDADVERRWSRILVWTDATVRAAEICGDIPGVVRARPSRACDPEMAAIVETVATFTDDHGADEAFAVAGRRVGGADAHEFTSPDIEREAGAAVVEATGAPVDLDDPGRTYYVECREREAFVSATAVEGPGGLPAGTQGRTVALVSGGIDSPVAAWEMMRRGAAVDPVYVDLGDFGGPDHRARAEAVTRELARRDPTEETALRVVPLGEAVADLVERVGATRMLSLRRAMLAAADEVAAETGAHSVVTGESLGQKSSQTGANLAVTDAAVSRPVHRPLLTWDKSDIVAAARDLGTYEDATLSVGCERAAPSHPETFAALDDVVAAEPPELLERARAAARDAERASFA